MNLLLMGITVFRRKNVHFTSSINDIISRLPILTVLQNIVLLVSVRNVTETIIAILDQKNLRSIGPLPSYEDKVWG